MGIMRFIGGAALLCAVCFAASPVPASQAGKAAQKPVGKPAKVAVSEKSTPKTPLLKGQVKQAAIHEVPSAKKSAEKVPGSHSAVAVAAAKTEGVDKASAGKSSGVPDTEPRDHQLRLCNAHPKGALNVWLDDEDTMHVPLTKGRPIQPRECREMRQLMRVGDYLEFRLEGVPQHVFVPAAPVEEGTIALHAVYEKTPGIAGVYLHYFDRLTYPQVAIVDVAPNAKGKAALPAARLQCAGGECTAGKVENAKFGQVLPINPGQYDVEVDHRRVELDAALGQSYAILRLGEGDLLVYPPAGAVHKSGAHLASVAAVLLGAVVALVL